MATDWMGLSSGRALMGRTGVPRGVAGYGSDPPVPFPFG